MCELYTGGTLVWLVLRGDQEETSRELPETTKGATCLVVLKGKPEGKPNFWGSLRNDFGVETTRKATICGVFETMHVGVDFGFWCGLTTILGFSTHKGNDQLFLFFRVGKIVRILWNS